MHSKISKILLIILGCFSLITQTAHARNSKPVKVISSSIVSISNVYTGDGLNSINGLSSLPASSITNSDYATFNWKVEYLENGSIRFKNYANGTCIISTGDVATNNLGESECYTQHAFETEFFELELTGSGAYQIKKTGSPYCISITNLTDVILDHCDDSEYIDSLQLWSFSPYKGAAPNLNYVKTRFKDEL